MIRPAAPLLALAVLVLGIGDAAAHRLKLFATAEGQTVSGYGFFVGGGRAAGAPIVARDGAGAEIWRGTTGEDGGFRFDTPAAGLTLLLDAGDGHAAELTLGPDRFAPATPASPPVIAADAPTSAPIARDDAALAALVAAEVDKAVARQIRPLLEASAAAEARLRLNDILGGLGWIAGLVGVGLIAARRKRS